MKDNKKYILIPIVFIILFSSIVIGKTNEALDIQVIEDEIPIGGIIIWTGSSNDFNNWGVMKNNTDWHLCNGNNDTTDLQGQFIVGYDPEDNDYDFIGETGGEKKHTLTVAEMPYHEHTYNDIYHQINNRDLRNGLTKNAEGYAYGSGSTTSGAGGSEEHENRPPFYTVAFIQKIA